jgi:hypothetical protein
VHCVANGKEARDKATEGGAEQEWASTGHFRCGRLGRDARDSTYLVSL